MASKKVWFKNKRHSYIPCTWQGWVLYIPFVVYLIGSLSFVILSEATLVEGFLTVFSQWVAGTVTMTWVASIFSDN